MFDNRQHQRLEAIRPEPTLEAYMSTTYARLGDNYRTNDRRFRESCGAVAFDIANYLLQADRAPAVLCVKGRALDQGNYRGEEALIPRRFSGAVTFGAHVACVCDGQVYDPMVSPTPIPLREYAERAFLNDDVSVEPEYLTSEYVRKVLS